MNNYLNENTDKKQIELPLQTSLDCTETEHTQKGTTKQKEHNERFKWQIKFQSMLVNIDQDKAKLEQKNKTKMWKLKCAKQKIDMNKVAEFPVLVKLTVPKAVLAGVASFLIQKDTQERTTVSMQGM